jgi:anti-anti-sigma factor
MQDNRDDTDAVTLAIEADGTPLITVVGEIDISSASGLNEVIQRALANAPPEIAFDLSGVRFMDSSGLAAMVAVRAAGHHVSVRSASHVVRRVIEVTGLADALGLVP